jgi:hypothetical protein
VARGAAHTQDEKAAAFVADASEAGGQSIDGVRIDAADDVHALIEELAAE